MTCCSAPHIKYFGSASTGLIYGLDRCDSLITNTCAHCCRVLLFVMVDNNKAFFMSQKSDDKNEK